MKKSLLVAALAFSSASGFAEENSEPLHWQSPRKDGITNAIETSGIIGDKVALIVEKPSFDSVNQEFSVESREAKELRITKLVRKNFPKKISLNGITVDIEQKDIDNLVVEFNDAGDIEVIYAKFLELTSSPLLVDENGRLKTARVTADLWFLALAGRNLNNNIGKFLSEIVNGADYLMDQPGEELILEIDEVVPYMSLIF